MSSQSKSFNGNYFIVLFKTDLSRFINKLSIRSNLTLLESIAKMLKLSKFIGQSLCDRWLGYFRLFNVFKAFFCKIGDPHLLIHSGIKATKGFSVISNLLGTTRITINYSRANFLL